MICTIERPAEPVGEHGPGGSHAEAGCRCPQCRPELWELIEFLRVLPTASPCMSGPCRNCGTSAWACFASGPCCGRCDH